MSYQFVRRMTVIIALLAAAGLYTASAIATPINGVQFEWLNTHEEDIEWILDNLGAIYPDHNLPTNYTAPTDAYGPPGPGGSAPAVIAPGTGPLVTTEVNNLLAQYKAAGVNYIGLFISVSEIDNYCNNVGGVGYNKNSPSDFYNPNASYSSSYSFCNDYSAHPYPQLNPDFVIALQNFINITNSGPYAGQFKIGITFFTQTAQTGYLCESEGGGNIGDTPTCPDNGDPNNPAYNHAYGNAEEYLANWINALIPTNNNIGIVMLGGQLKVCDGAGCDQDPGADAEVTNNGEWIKNIWQWKQSAFPNLNATYEALSLSENDTAICNNSSDPMIECVAHWANTYTPGLPYIAVSLYVPGAPGDSSSQYTQEANTQLSAYASAQPATPTPLWIEEYGGPISTNNFIAQDQTNTINGFLAASFCGTDASQPYPKFLWNGGYDYNPSNPTGAQQFGVVSGFDSVGNPMMEPAWSTLSQWYGYALSNAASSNGAVSTASDTSVTENLSICGLNGEMSFSNIVQTPTHGSVTITNTATGAFNYVPVAGFFGNDTFQFTITYPDGSTSPVTTESVTVYSPAEIAVTTNYLVP